MNNGPLLRAMARSNAVCVAPVKSHQLGEIERGGVDAIRRERLLCANWKDSETLGGESFRDDEGSGSRGGSGQIDHLLLMLRWQ